MMKDLMRKFLNLIRSGSKNKSPDKIEDNLYQKNREIIEYEIEKDNTKVTSEVISETKKPKVVLYISQLGPGGAERQLCNTAVKLHEMGFDVTVLTTSPPEGELGYFLPYLTASGVPARAAALYNAKFILKKHSDNPHLNIDALKSVPEYLKTYVYALVNELLSLKPDVLHCWLDYANIIGGLAGFISGVPRILLGGRNVNPTHFPVMNNPWFEDWYKVLIKSRRMVFLNNSKAGAVDYAQWLEVPPSRFHVINNGMDFSQFKTVLKKDVDAFRRSVGTVDTPLVAGVFRLSPEKRPFDFISVVKKVKEVK